MSLRIDNSEWISGSLVIGNTGGGVIAQNLAVIGDNGSGFLFNDVSLPTDNDKEICGRFTFIPVGLSVYAYEDGSLIASAVDGTYTAQYQLYVDYVPVGAATDIVFTFGAGINQASILWSEGSETFVSSANASGTTISISFNVTENSDSLSSSSVSLIVVTSAQSELPDTITSSTNVEIVVSSTNTESGDTLTSSLFTIEVPNNITFVILENPDSVISSVGTLISISAQLTESSDYSTLTITYTLNTGGEMLNADGDHEFDHAPLASLDYGFDWASSGWLASGETIATSTWTVESPLVASLEQIAGGVTSLFVTGGVAGNIYKITNTITTSLTRTDSRTIKLSCKQR